MSKKKEPASSSAAPRPIQKPAATETSSMAATELYSFPTKCRCPRCGSLHSRCRGTHGGVQYRRCGAGDCGADFQVQGTKI